MTLDLHMLRDAVSDGAAFRRVQKLQPIGGKGDKIFPPTYPPERRGESPRHVFELRRMEGKETWCVLIDSVQSQANRLEEALLEASEKEVEEGNLPLPYIAVDFSSADLGPLRRITSLDAPHRIYDAIMRDSLLDGTPFMESKEGRLLAEAKPADATALLEISPTALLFGVWHSQGEGGGLGAKFPRTLVSEIIGIDTPVEEGVFNTRTGLTEIRTRGRRPGSRIDPLGILRKAEVYKGASASDWSTESRKGTKKVRPSEINHSNIAPTVEPLGVTCDHVEHRATITLAGLRRLHFGDRTRTAAGRELVASLGLFALSEQDIRGYALRSRCDLVCDAPAPLELVHSNGSTTPLELNSKDARALYRKSYEQAEDAGFKFRSLNLKPQDKLIEIVRRSRQLALLGQSGDEDESSS